MKKPKSLTIKQENFCQAYIRIGNKSKAYCQAYDIPQEKAMSAATRGARLANNPVVIARIKQLKEEAQARNNISLDELIQTLAAMIRFDITDLYDENGGLKNLKDLPKETRQMIQQLDVSEVYTRSVKDRELIGYTKKVKTYSRLDALEKLMKHLGGYEKDNQQSKSIQNIVFLNLGDGEPEP